MLCSLDIPGRPSLFIFIFKNGGGVDLGEKEGGGELGRVEGGKLNPRFYV